MFRGPSPQSVHPYVSVITAKLDHPQTVALLSGTIESVHVHWVKGQWFPCLKLWKECPHCNGHKPARWKGFLCAYDFTRKERVLVELTEEAGRAMKLQAHLTDWRGKQLTLYRSRHKKGKVSVVVKAPPPSWPRPQNMVRAWDPWFCWNRIWRLSFDQNEWHQIRTGMVMINLNDLAEDALWTEPLFPPTIDNGVEIPY